MSRIPAAEWSSRLFKKTRRFRLASKSLGQRVKQIRENRKLTLEAAAEFAGMDLTHWQKIEAGTLNPTLVTLLRVAEGLGVEIVELFRTGKRR